MLAYGWAYWVVIIVIIVFLILGGQLNVESWIVTLRPSVSLPFARLIIPLIVIGTILNFAAWLGVPMRSFPRRGTPFSQYNFFRRRTQETRDDEETNWSWISVSVVALRDPAHLFLVNPIKDIFPTHFLQGLPDGLTEMLEQKSAWVNRPRG